MRRAGAPSVILLLVLGVAWACADEVGSSAGPVEAAAAPPPAPTLVDDSVCASCHADIAASYSRTNKHLSISAFDPARAPESLPTPVPVRNDLTGLSYEAFVRGDTLFQRELRTDPTGRVVHDRVHAADLVVGSGNATRSYLMSVGGHITQMPITWYVHRERWFMSPGYDEANDRFARKIGLVCMTCHAARPEHTPGTQNHFAELPTGIGCASCHGGGADHVALRRSAEPPPAGVPDTTIVNPARLTRGERLANCQQCHLAGLFVYREGEDPTSFQPGWELYRHRSVFVPADQLSDPDWVGIDSHPVRLARSACYQASEMTCETCHDPHRPAEELAPDHYRQRCLGCHADAAGGAGMCTRHGDAASADAATGDCAGCHMAQGGTSDVPHVIFTDHWIRREPGPPRDPAEGRPAFEGTATIELVALQSEGRSSAVIAPRPPSDDPDHLLEEAAAYWEFYETMHRHSAYPPRVAALARAGLAGGADRLDARIALGRALAEMDSLGAARVALQEAALRYPDDAWVHFWLGAVIDEAGDPRGALPALRAAVSLQPRMVEARSKLADALYRAGLADEALGALEAVVAEDPVNQPRAWHNLGLLRSARGDAPGALAAFGEASRLDPDLVDAHVQLGTLLMSGGSLDAAEAAFRKAVVADPRSTSALGSMAVLNLTRGDTARARTLLERVLTIEPGNGPARQLLSGIGGSGRLP